jgi:glycosyltransferase involved in cell wall biosynthesis
MKVLFYTPYSLRYGGGGERWILEIVPRLLGRGHEARVVTLDYPESSKETDWMEGELDAFQRRVKWIELPAWSLPFGVLLPTPSSLVELLQEARSSDVVLFNNFLPFQEGLLVGIRKAARTPVVGVYQAPIVAKGLLNRGYRRVFSRRLARFFDAYQVLNREDQGVLEGWGVEREKIHLIPNAVDGGRFSLRGRRGKTFRVLFVGRLNYHKGFDLLCRVVEAVNRDEVLRERIRFRVLGSGFWKSRLDQLLEGHSNVEYRSRIPHPELPEVYSGSDLLFMPSRWEGSPMVLLEALASGLPVVAQDVRGIHDVLEGKAFGALVPPEDPEEMAARVQEFYRLWRDDPEGYGALREEARAWAVHRYGWDRVLGEFLGMLEKAAKGKSHASFLRLTSEGAPDLCSQYLADQLSRSPSVRIIEVHLPQRGGSNPLSFLFQTLRLLWRIDRTPADLLHLPSQELGRYVPFLRYRHLVLTVHDLIPLELCQPSNALSRTFRRWDEAGIRKADHIIAPSEATKRDLMEKLEIPEERITVIPYGVDRTLFHPGQEGNSCENPLTLSAPYLLYVGSYQPRKNLPFLLKAFQRLKEGGNYGPLKLCLVGGGAPQYVAETRRWIEALDLSREVILQGPVPFSDLPPLYRQAEALLFPSLYEGFGLPPLEAMACGTPVVASNISSLPEVVEDAALLVPPTDVEAFQLAIKRVLEDRGLRETLVQRGLLRAREFSWEKAAAETLRVYNCLLS